MSREQLVTILWRQEGSPASQTEAGFADSSTIATWATQAVAWAKENNVIAGRSGSRFDPKANASRAEVAAVLTNAAQTIWAEATPTPSPSPSASTRPSSGGSAGGGSSRPSGGGSSGGSSGGGSTTPTPAPTPTPTPTPEPTPGPTPEPTPEPTPDPEPSPKVLIAYFSATNNTQGVANHIKTTLGDSATLHEIVPAQPYTADDLKYYTDCRADREQNDPTARPAIADSCKVENMEDYDVVFLGYPIWHGQAPKIMYTFVESYDLSGKTIVPFCTSASSPMGTSATNLAAATTEATWLSGSRFSGSASQSTVANWVNGLDLPEP